MSKLIHYFIGAIIVCNAGPQDIQGAHKQLIAWLAQWSIDQYPTGHGPVIFARMGTGNEKILTPKLEHEEISNSQITTGIGIPQYDTALP